MQTNARGDTRFEKAIRAAVYHRGLRFRKNHLIETPTMRVRADMVFERPRIAVFLDGCYWHACSAHLRRPRANSAYWMSKLNGNVLRDREANRALASDGWRVLRFWEHDDPPTIVESICTVVASHASLATPERDNGR